MPVPPDEAESGHVTGDIDMALWREHRRAEHPNCELTRADKFWGIDKLDKKKLGISEKPEPKSSKHHHPFFSNLKRHFHNLSERLHNHCEEEPKKKQFKY